MNLMPNPYPDESIDAYCYVENNSNVLNLLNELSIDIDKFYFSTYTHLGTPRYTMISVLALADGKVIEFYAESRNNMHFKRAITIPQDTFEAIKLVPKEAREEYLAAIIKDAYNEGIKELSKPRG